MEDHSKIFSAVTIPVKGGDWEKPISEVRIIGLFTINIFEHPENFKNIIVHKSQESAVKVCGVHCRTVQKDCNETFIPLADNQVFASPRKTNERQHYVINKNDFDEHVLHQTVYEFYDKIYRVYNDERKIMKAR
jgi:hypothetical protein